MPSRAMLLAMWCVVVTFPAISRSATKLTHWLRVSSPARSAAATCERTLVSTVPVH